ncbi:class A sortase [Niallia taxi]|nr:class A sortase [Niallia taxi]MDE5051750.1 class A sortase [Niallia taxi]
MKNNFRRVFYYFSFILLITGFIITCLPFLKDKALEIVISNNLQKNYNEITLTKPSYEFNEIKPITVKDIWTAATHDLPIIGKLKIPSVQIALPIMEGVSNEALAIGAVTLKESQQMGQGNYALAGHRMNNPKLLFSPLERIALGDFLYLSNEEKEYTYRVVEKSIIESSKVEVVEDTAGMHSVTLITCYDNGTKRLLVKGMLIK